MAPRGTPEGVFAVLVVCTGNICRSPVAELLLRGGLPEGSGVEVGSAGLQARVGEPVAPAMAGLLRARGIDPAGFAARQFEVGMARAADLVLTMTAEQRAAVVRVAPAAVRRTFTLREFADLALLTGPELGMSGAADRLAALVAGVPRARSRRTGSGVDDDILDPHGRSAAVFAEVEECIRSAVGDLLWVLRC